MYSKNNSYDTRDVSLKHLTSWLLSLYFISTPKMINPMSQHTQESGENKKNNSCCIHTTLSSQLWANIFLLIRSFSFFLLTLKLLESVLLPWIVVTTSYSWRHADIIDSDEMKELV